MKPITAFLAALALLTSTLSQAVPAVAATTQLITFEDVATGALNGQYPSGVIDWGSGQWRVDPAAPAPPLTSRTLGFSGANPSLAGFTLLGARRLVQVDAINTASVPNTIVVACTGLGLIGARELFPGETYTIRVNPESTCTQITFTSFNAGPSTHFDNLVVENPPSPPITATFDTLANPNRPLNGQYPSGDIDWGTNRWFLSRPWRLFTTNSIGFNGTGPTSASFTFLRPLRLVQLDAYNGGSTGSGITLSCGTQFTVQIDLAPGQLRTIPTNWLGACATVTIGSSNGWNTNFDNLVYISDESAPPPPITPTPTPTPVTGTLTVTFNDLSQPNRTLNGQYPSGAIDWGTNSWYLSSPWRQFTTNSIGFNGAGPTSATFALVVPRRLVRLDAYNGGPGPSTITVQCDAQPLVQVNLAAGQLATISTNWTGAACGVIRIGSSNGWNTNFDNLVFDS